MEIFGLSSLSIQTLRLTHNDSILEYLRVSVAKEGLVSLCPQLQGVEAEGLVNDVVVYTA